MGRPFNYGSMEEAKCSAYLDSFNQQKSARHLLDVDKYIMVRPGVLFACNSPVPVPIP